ncbi:MAG: class I SAM-dependent methyltransferase [Planctomycetota bacterium]
MFRPLLALFDRSRPARAARAGRALGEQAAALLAAGQPEEAAATARQALTLLTDCPEAHAVLARLSLTGQPYLDTMRQIQAALRPATYVEVGVCVGSSLERIAAGTRVVGIDPDPRPRGQLPPGFTIFAQTSDDFFATHNLTTELGGPVELAFIDGMHLFEYALRDFMNIEAHCTPDATILVHDCYPLDENTAARDRITRFWTGDVWRLVVALKRHRPDLSIVTFDAPLTGLVVIRQLDPASRVIREHLAEIIRETLAVPFSDIADDKPAQLNLRPGTREDVAAMFPARA